MNPGSRDTPTEESTPRLGSGDGHGHSKAGGSVVMHDHGRHSPASAHSPVVSGIKPGLHQDSGRSSRGFGTPSFSPTGLPGFNLDHLPFLFNSPTSLIFPPFPGSLFPPVLPPNFLPPPLQPPITSLFPSPNAECEVSSSGWPAHSSGSRNTSSLGSTSSEGDMAAKIDGRTVRSSRCSPDVNLQPTSLSSTSVRKIWESTAVDPVCIPDVDMPLSLVTRRETTSRGSSAAESGVCTGDSVARAASSETSRTPSLDGESGCHAVSENSGVQEQTVAADQPPAQWNSAKVSSDAPQGADDSKPSTNDDMWSSTTAVSRSSGIALPPRKRLTRNAEDLHSSSPGQSANSSGAASSPSTAPNFRSCWKKFAAKSNVSGPSSHRAFVGKPQYDCRTYFQKLAEQHRAAAASKAFVPGKGKGHCYRNANKTSPRSSDQNTGSPRVTRSQSKPKKTQSPKSSPAEPPAPVRKSTRKKSINTRFDEYDRTVGKNKKSKTLLPDANTAASDGGKETSQAAGDESTTNSQRKHRRRGKQSVTDADSTCGDVEDSTSQSQFTNEVSQPVSETDGKISCSTSSLPAAAQEGSDSNATIDDVAEPEPSVIITVLPPKFRHFKTKTATATFDSSQPQTNGDRPIAGAANECSNSESAASVKSDSSDAAAVAATAMQPEFVAGSDECRANASLQTSTDTSTPAETSGGSSTEELKVSRSHSVGGRKSLLYRSGATTDNEPYAEAKFTSTSGPTDSCAVMSSDAVGIVSVEQISSSENLDNTEDMSALEHGVDSSEQSIASLNSTVSDAALAKNNEQSGTDDIDIEQHVEAVSSNSFDIKSTALGIGDSDMQTTAAPSAVSNTTSDHPSAFTSKETVQTTELDSNTASVDNAAQRLDGCLKEPADSLDECDSQTKLETSEGGDVSLKSTAPSVESQSSEAVGVVTASVSTESRLCTTPVTTVTDTSGISCRTKSVDVGGSLAVEPVSQNSESLKRHLPDEAIFNDDTKRCCMESIDLCTDRLSADTVSEPIDDTANTNAVDNFISTSGELSSQTCSVPNGKSYTATAGQLQVTLSPSVKNSSKSDTLKPVRSKSTKASRRLKPNRSHRTVKTVVNAQSPVFEKSNSSTAETFPAESESELNRSSKKCNPPLLEKLLDGNCETPPAELTAVAKYSVANSVDKICDMKTDVSSAQSNSEQKTLRISLVALSETSTAALRAKDLRTESVCNADKMSSSSPAVAVYTVTTTASVVNNLKQLTSAGSPADAEPHIASSRDSSALERDSSKLLSRCKSLSVVLEKMQNDRCTPPPTASVANSTGRRRKGGLARRRFGSAAKAEVSVNDSLSTETPALLAASSVDDEYRFSDDSVSDSLVPQRVLRPERKTSSRKAKNSLPSSDRVDVSPSATSDSSSRCAASSVDSSVASGNAGVGSLTPNAIQKVPSKPETGSGRSRRRKHNLQDDEDTRSLSPITQNGSSPVPFVEASLDGHRLKLRITKCANRTVVPSAGDAIASAPPTSLLEFTDSKTESKVEEVPTPDLEPVPSLEVSREPVSRRRRQLKVEGVRSRFLTLHKPSGVVPTADHVKCRLVKVGRRQWMSVGGEEPDDDSSTAQPSDAETPARNSPAAPVDEVAQQPTRDRLLHVNETKKQRRRGRPPKAKTDLADSADLSAVTAKRNKKKVKADTGRLEVSFSKPEPLPVPEVVSRPARVDPVPWLDGEADESEMQPYCSLGDNSSRTIATDINEYRLCVSTPAEFTSDIDLVISNALSDCGIELAYSTVLTPKSMFFVPSELERLMEALVLDDLRRQPRTDAPPTIAVPETHILSSASIARTFSYSDSVSLPVFSPLRNDREVDLLLSQPSLRLRNSTLPVDANDSSDYDCTVVGYEYPAPAYSYPDAVELPPLLDGQFIDEDYLLPPACLTDPQFYSCVDLVL